MLKQDEIDKNLNILDKEYYLLDKERINLANSFDKYLLSFATGSLFLSISFTKTINGNLIYGSFLQYGWMFLIVSIIFTLLSILLSQYAFNRQMYIVSLKTKDIEKGNRVGEYKNYWNKAVTFTVLISASSFVLGISTLSYFYFKNLSFGN